MYKIINGRNLKQLQLLTLAIQTTFGIQPQYQVRIQISKHPNKNIGIQPQYQYPRLLTFNPIQCQAP
jgi:hypothetical protein